MLDKQKGDIVFECDRCGEVFDSGASNFDAARGALKMEGWKARKIADVWCHYCRDCVGKR